MPLIWILILIAIIWFLPILFPIFIILVIVKVHNQKKNERKAEKDYNDRLNGTIVVHGEPSRTIRYDDKYMLIYENRKMIYIEGQMLEWNSIIDYRIPQEHEVYETDNSNMFKRSLLGWLFFGNIGGLLGGATSRRVSSSYKNNQGRFHLLVQTNKIQRPNIHLLIADSNTFEEIRSCLNIIKRSV